MPFPRLFKKEQQKALVPPKPKYQDEAEWGVRYISAAIEGLMDDLHLNAVQLNMQVDNTAVTLIFPARGPQVGVKKGSHTMPEIPYTRAWSICALGAEESWLAVKKPLEDTLYIKYLPEEGVLEYGAKGMSKLAVIPVKEIEDLHLTANSDEDEIRHALGVCGEEILAITTERGHTPGNYLTAKLSINPNTGILEGAGRIEELKKFYPDVLREAKTAAVEAKAIFDEREAQKSKEETLPKRGPGSNG